MRQFLSKDVLGGIDVEGGGASYQPSLWVLSINDRHQKTELNCLFFFWGEMTLIMNR
jgi:hypothetical protein